MATLVCEVYKLLRTDHILVLVHEGHRKFFEQLGKVFSFVQQLTETVDYAVEAFEITDAQLALFLIKNLASSLNKAT